MYDVQQQDLPLRLTATRATCGQVLCLLKIFLFVALSCTMRSIEARQGGLRERAALLAFLIP